MIYFKANRQLSMLLGGLFFLLLSGCLGQSGNDDRASAEVPSKSQLVQRLESIFYAGNFAGIPEKVFRAEAYGAVGDGKQLNTAAIQKTIDAAAAAGGGKVVFLPGTYLSGALFLKSEVELHLGEGVTIKAIQDDAHYPDKWTRVAGVEMDWPAALINIYKQKNVRITGKGVVDGNGKFWWDKFWGDPPRSGGMYTDYTKRNIRWAVDYDCKRVRAVVVYESNDVLLKDFTVKRSGFWTISLTFSRRVHVDGLVIRNNIGGFGPSSDGINTDSSTDVLVENCDIDCNDDNLCIKAGRDSDGLRVNRPCENIVYRNCITRAGHGLFTIGSETSGGMRNIEVYGLEAFGTNTGIRFKSAKVRGGLIENVSFHDIRMVDVKNPFQFELNWYPEYSYPTIPEAELTTDIPRHWKVMTTPVEPAEKGIPEFRDIHFKNISVKGAERGFYANAYPEQPIHLLTWENISIEAAKGGSLNYAADWTMNNVTMTTKAPAPLITTNSSGIGEFTWISKEETMEAGPGIAALMAKNPREVIFPVAPGGQKLIQANDSIAFAENMTVYLLAGKDQEFTCHEPLGDGFYFSPLTIVKKGDTFKISGEREHTWTIIIAAETKPADVLGVDNWTYVADRRQIIASKAGKNFEVNIKK